MLWREQFSAVEVAGLLEQKTMTSGDIYRPQDLYFLAYIQATETCVDVKFRK